MPYKDKSKQLAYQNEWVRKRRLAWIKDQGGKCFDCGATEGLVCDRDIYARPDCNRTHRIWTWSIKRLEAELQHCRVRCWDCQHKKVAAYSRANLRPHMLPVHGSYVRYRKGCRCMPCCIAWAKNNLARNVKRRKKK